jgi:hypothetical protein
VEGQRSSQGGVIAVSERGSIHGDLRACSRARMDRSRLAADARTIGPQSPFTGKERHRQAPGQEKCCCRAREMPISFGFCLSSYRCIYFALSSAWASDKDGAGVV